jgi:single-strand DNA-binding protein
MSYQKIIVVGNLTRDPELKATEKSHVCNFSVAVDNTWGEGSSFFNCVAWGKTAELVNQYFRKGKQILVEGWMKQEKYKNKEGQDVTTWKLFVDRFSFVGNKSDSDSSPRSSGSASASDLPQVPAMDDDDEDMPF